LTELNIDNLLTKARNKFLLSNAAAGRARQIADGSLPYIDNFDPTNSVITALREIAADKIRIRVITAGASKKAQELLIAQEVVQPSALERLAREKKASAPKKKEKKKKK
jgi:DNA-directed RNA polymerase subunit omega